MLLNCVPNVEEESLLKDGQRNVCLKEVCCFVFVPQQLLYNLSVVYNVITLKIGGSSS